MTFGYFLMLLVGVSLGLMGGGGAILTVPIFVYLFNEPPSIATGYSLFVVGIASLFGVHRYQKQSLVDYRGALAFAWPSFIGTFLARGMLVPSLPDVIFQWGPTIVTKDKLIMTVFALVMLGASYSMIRKAKIETADTQHSANAFSLGILGFFVGSLAGFVGAGGGFLIVPVLVLLVKMPMPRAVGTSLLIIAMNSLVGFIGDVTAGNAIDWWFLGRATGIASLGVFLGVFLSKFVPANQLKKGFGWFILAMGTYVLLSQLAR